jgi:hypothetical protein
MDSKQEIENIGTHPASLHRGLASKTHSLSPQGVYWSHVVTLLVYTALGVGINMAIHEESYCLAQWLAGAVIIISVLAMAPVARPGSFGRQQTGCSH